MSNLFQEFKRRNVFRVGMAYAVFSWLIVQVADIVVPRIGLPEWVDTLILFLLLIGFVPTLMFAWAFELTPEGLKREHEVDRSDSITAQTGRKLDIVTLVALTAVVGIVAADRFLVGDTPQPRVSAGTAQALSIAVLPFIDLSPQQNQEYFSDGITEEILNGLARLGRFKVAGRTSSFAFKGQNIDLREIGAALGVQHVVEGSVRTDGDRLRITAQLIDVSDGFHVWSDTYEGRLKDVFDVQDEISAAIVHELRGSLLGDAEPAGGSKEIDVATYQRYLKARDLINARTNESLQEARAILEDIVAAEPEFPPGLTSLAESVLLLQGGDFSSYGDLDREEAIRIAKPLLERALEIDPNSADAYAVKGLAHYGLRNWGEAEEALRRAVSLNPSLSNAWNWLAITAKSQGRSQESLDYLARATAIDPLWLVPNDNLIFRYLDLGRRDEARQIVERLRPFHQDSAGFHAVDAVVKQREGELAEALLANRRATRLAPNTPSIVGHHVYTLVLLQEFDEAETLLPQPLMALRSYVAEDWDDTLPGLRAALDRDPLVHYPLDVYLDGANYIGDFEAVADYYDTHVGDPSILRENALDYHAIRFAPAMRALGRDDDAAALAATFRQHLERRREQGEVGSGIEFDWARYYAMTGEHDRAFEMLDRALEIGVRAPFWRYIPEFEPLNADPRMRALKQRNLDAINAERAKLGWKPVDGIGVVGQV